MTEPAPSTSVPDVNTPAILLPSPHRTRRGRWQIILGIFLCIQVICFFWFKQEGTKIVLENVYLNNLPSPIAEKNYAPSHQAMPLPSGLRLMLIADVHQNYEMLEKSIALGLKEKPHACFILGDLCTGSIRFTRIRDYVQLLKKLNKEVPTYAILGNHDMNHLFLIVHTYEKAGIPLLRNRAEDITLNGKKLRIVGLGDYGMGDDEPEKCLPLASAPPEHPVLLLSHNPDSKAILGTEKAPQYYWSALFCGHTHGGQILLPGLPPIIMPCDRRFVSGLYSWWGKPLYITRGVGAHLGVRFRCPAEVTIIHT